MPNGSTESVLVDSNVLVYAVDPTEQSKTRRADNVLRGLSDADAGTISAQVVAEFYSAATRPRAGGTPLLTATDAELWIDRWLASFRCTPLTEAIAREAARAARQYQMNIFDAQVWATAKLSGATILLTEDIQSREFIEGVQYVNPFAADFELAHIGL